MPRNELPIDFYLAGSAGFDQVLGIQRRLAYEVSDIHSPRLAVLISEHANLITVGRDGSRAHIHATNEELRRNEIQVQWVARTGGCVPHVRGQLAIYPIIPLRQVGWTVKEFRRRFQLGLCAAIEQLNVRAHVPENSCGVWGDRGLLAAIGIAVRNWTTSYGAYLNVNPAMQLFRRVQTAGDSSQAGYNTNMSSLFAERRLAVSISGVRTTVIEHLVRAFGAPRHHVHALAPLLTNSREFAGESCAHV